MRPGGEEDALVSQINSTIDQKLAKSLTETKTNEYRDVIRKAIIEKNPRIGAQQIKKLLNFEIRQIQSHIKQQALFNKVVVAQSLERFADVTEDKVNDEAKKIINKH